MPKILSHDEKWLSVHDVFWLLNDEPVNEMVINFVFHMERDISLTTISEYLAKWAVNFPRFRSRVVRKGLVTYAWEPVDDFNPLRSGCVGEHELSEPTDQALTAHVDKTINEPLPRDGCLWRMYRISNVPGGGCVLLWRVHHCICDGTGMVMVFRSIFTDVPAIATPPPRAVARPAFDSTGQAQPTDSAPKSPQSPQSPQTPQTPPTPQSPQSPMGWVLTPPPTRVSTVSTPFLFVAATLTLLLSGGVLSCRQGCMRSVLLSAVVSVWMTVALFWGEALVRAFFFVVGVVQPDTPSTLKAPLKGCKATSVLASFMTVDQAKAVAQKLSPATGERYTLNDVMCALTAGAFRRYFDRTGVVLKGSTLRGVVPVNVRSSKEKIRCENKVSIVFVNLPVAERTVQSRVSQMHERMEEIKRGFDVPLGIMLFHVIILLSDKLRKLVTRFYSQRASMVITNVNARSTAMIFADTPLRNAYGWVPAAGGIGMGVSIISYMGNVNVGLVADKAQVPDISVLSQCFVEEWEEMTKL
eukprot:RCo033487